MKKKKKKMKKKKKKKKKIFKNKEMLIIKKRQKKRKERGAKEKQQNQLWQGKNEVPTAWDFAILSEQGENWFGCAANRREMGIKEGVGPPFPPEPLLSPLPHSNFLPKEICQDEDRHRSLLPRRRSQRLLTRYVESQTKLNRSSRTVLCFAI